VDVLDTQLMIGEHSHRLEHSIEKGDERNDLQEVLKTIKVLSANQREIYGFDTNADTSATLYFSLRNEFVSCVSLKKLLNSRLDMFSKRDCATDVITFRNCS